MKFLIFSDAHIHPHKRSTERLNDCLNALNWAFKCAGDLNIEYILFAGDLFHDRQKIDVLTYQKTFEIFDRWAGAFKGIYLLLGNHDMWHTAKWDISSVIPLSSMPQVTVITKPCTLHINDFPVSFLPYTKNPIEDIKKTKDIHRALLIAHVAIDGALWNVKYNTRADVTIEHDGEMMKVGPEIFKNWGRVFLGHYHAAQQLTENVEYIGSPLQLDFGEVFQEKHIIVYDADTDERCYLLNSFSPKHYIIPESDISKYDLENNFVRIIVDDIGSSDIVEMRRSILAEHNVGSLEIKQKPHEVESHVVDDAKAILFREDEMLERYMDEVGVGELNRDLLLKIGKDTIKKAKLKDEKS